MKLFIVSALLTLSAVSGSVLRQAESNFAIEGRITNGKTAAPKQFPYQVGLNFLQSNDSGEWCGGSLISNTFVLTAAHCTFGAFSVEVFLGTIEISKPEVYHEVNSTNFKLHPDPAFDIALIRIPYVELSDSINIVRLPKLSTKKTYNKHKAVEAGWGLTSGDAKDLPDLLQFADLTVISIEECRKALGDPELPSHILCAQGANKASSCFGDSGGALVDLDSNRQIGIAAFSAEKCESRFPSGFTRITDFLDWIKENSGVYYLD